MSLGFLAKLDRPRISSFGVEFGADGCSEKSDRPLDCWKEVEQFKAEVAKVEQVCHSLSSASTALTIQSFLKSLQ